MKKGDNLAKKKKSKIDKKWQSSEKNDKKSLINFKKLHTCNNE